jgi:hypothetical protein
MLKFSPKRDSNSSSKTPVYDATQAVVSSEVNSATSMLAPASVVDPALSATVSALSYLSISSPQAGATVSVASTTSDSAIAVVQSPSYTLPVVGAAKSRRPRALCDSSDEEKDISVNNPSTQRRRHPPQDDVFAMDAEDLTEIKSVQPFSVSEASSQVASGSAAPSLDPLIIKRSQFQNRPRIVSALDVLLADRSTTSSDTSTSGSPLSSASLSSEPSSASSSASALSARSDLASPSSLLSTGRPQNKTQFSQQSSKSSFKFSFTGGPLDVSSPVRLHEPTATPPSSPLAGLRVLEVQHDGSVDDATMLAVQQRAFQRSPVASKQQSSPFSIGVLYWRGARTQLSKSAQSPSFWKASDSPTPRNGVDSDMANSPATYLTRSSARRLHPFYTPENSAFTFNPSAVEPNHAQ